MPHLCPWYHRLWLLGSPESSHHYDSSDSCRRFLAEGSGLRGGPKISGPNSWNLRWHHIWESFCKCDGELKKKNFFLNCGKIHNMKVNILIMFEGHYTCSHCCASIATFHLQSSFYLAKLKLAMHSSLPFPLIPTPALGSPHSTFCFYELGSGRHSCSIYPSSLFPLV